jgi:plasmid replication initiation protein
MSSRVLSLYRGLLRHGGRFAQNSFRQYALRRTRERFREHRAETDAARVEQLLAQAEEQLAIVKRQAVISALYPQERTVVEGKQ